MTAMETGQLQDLLVRIDERVKTIQEDIREINVTRRCASNNVKIQTLGRMVWGCLAGITALGGRMFLEILR